MRDVLKIIAIASTEIGTTEKPENSNKTKYGEWFGFDGVPWCAMFVSWVYHQAGSPLGNIGFLKGFAGCQTAVAHYRDEGKVVNDPVPGDLVFFDWNNDGRHDHVGIFIQDLGGNSFKTIEGNTSIHNQRNGGSVMLRTRQKGRVLFVRP